MDFAAVCVLLVLFIVYAAIKEPAPSLLFSGTEQSFATYKRIVCRISGYQDPFVKRTKTVSGATAKNMFGATLLTVVFWPLGLVALHHELTLKATETVANTNTNVEVTVIESGEQHVLQMRGKDLPRKLREFSTAADGSRIQRVPLGTIVAVHVPIEHGGELLFTDQRVRVTAIEDN